MFELERRMKAQHVGNSMTYLDVGLNFRYNFRLTKPQMAANLKISKYLR